MSGAYFVSLVGPDALSAETIVLDCPDPVSAFFKAAQWARERTGKGQWTLSDTVRPLPDPTVRIDD